MYGFMFIRKKKINLEKEMFEYLDPYDVIIICLIADKSSQSISADV